MKGEAFVLYGVCGWWWEGSEQARSVERTMEEQEKMWLAALGRELSKDRIEWRRKSCRGWKVDVISITNAVAA